MLFTPALIQKLTCKQGRFLKSKKSIFQVALRCLSIQSQNELNGRRSVMCYFNSEITWWSSVFKKKKNHLDLRTWSWGSKSCILAFFPHFVDNLKISSMVKWTHDLTLTPTPSFLHKRTDLRNKGGASGGTWTCRIPEILKADIIRLKRKMPECSGQKNIATEVVNAKSRSINI